MGITFAVSTVFKSKDETSKNFNRMGKNAKKFGETSSRAFKQASKSATSFGTITKGILAAGAIQKSLRGVSMGLSVVTTDFIAFDDAITAGAAKFKGLNLSTKEGQKTLDALRKSARETGAETKFSAAEAAGGLDFYATAGFNAAQAMAVIKPTAKLATIANLDLARTSDIASDSIGAFGLMTKDSTQLQKNFTRISDVMAKTMTSTNTNMEDMFESIKKGAPTFTSTGQSVETFNTLMGKMANAGVKGSESGTQLRNMMLRLAKPTAEAQGQLNKLGVRTKDSQGNFRDIIDVLADFETGLKGMGTANKAAALKTIFGTRSITGMQILLKEGTGSLREFRNELNNAGGSTEKMASIMEKSLGNRLKALRSAAIEVGFQLFSAFGEKGGNAIDNFTKFIRKIDLTPMINGIKFIASGISNLFRKVMAFGESSGIFAKVKEAITALEPAFFAVVDIVSTLFNFLSDIGVFSALGTAIGILIDSVTILAKVFVKLWDIAKPIFAGIGKVIKFLTQDLKGLSGFIGGSFSAIKGLFSSDEEEKKETIPQAPGRVAPNLTEIESRRQSSFKGRLDIAGAPEGSKLIKKSSGPDEIDIDLLAFN
jgi:TP901 family phage tail tape measure protein